MGKDYQTVIREIIHHITRQCDFSTTSEFFVGITINPEVSLFSEHSVNRKHGCWTYCEATNGQHAKQAEKMLINQGMEGDPGHGETIGTIVYCYKITADTIE